MPEFSHSAGGVVLNRHGEVLIVQQRDRSWSLPKGKIKEGEDPRNAAEREIIEESGLTDLRMVRILKSYSRFSLTNLGSEDTDSVRRITMYLFRTNQQELRPMDPRTPIAQWLPPEEVLKYLSHPKDKEFFESVLPELQKPHFKKNLVSK